jgi:hypothetical protein
MSLVAIDAALASAGEPDEALRAVVELLAAEPGVTCAAVAFLENGRLVPGPSAGAPDEERRHHATVRYKDDVVGQLWVDGDVDRAFLEAVADRIGAHVLLGWDTGGETWDP